MKRQHFRTCKAFVTGGAGFIGSHLVGELIEDGCSVIVYDNLTSGKLANIRQWKGNPGFRFVRGDLANARATLRAMGDSDVVFHLAAISKVDPGTPPISYLRNNVVATQNLLGAMVRSPSTKSLVFASSSTIYGPTDVMPTPESYGPASPISMYGGSKLACEALISSFSHIFGLSSVTLRLANVVGPRSDHGVVHDFLRKLRKSPKVLRIYGKGEQTKSYLYVDDCISAMEFAAANLRPGSQVFNVGSADQVTVKEIAAIVAKEMGLEPPRLRYGKDFHGGGWQGDVGEMLLSVDKLMSLGWSPRSNSAEAVALAARASAGKVAVR